MMLTSLDPKYEVKPQYHILVPMRDGVRLSIDLYIPQGKGPFPVILTRTPYSNADPERSKRLWYFAERGFVTAFQDCRGRYDSEGDWEPFRTEKNDAYDTLEWLSKQAFCNGKIGMTGRSYEGYCCWIAAADHHPALKAMIPIVPLPDPVLNVPYQNGVLFWNMIIWALMVHGRTNQDVNKVNWLNLYKHVPLRTLDKAAGFESATWQHWLDHPTFDDWWKEVCYMHLYQKVDLPMLHVCGWYDDDGISTYMNYPGMRQHAATQYAKDNQRLIIGPWPHKTNVSSKTGELDFGPQALIDLNGEMLKFFAKHLANENHYQNHDPRCKIFIMGENRWHEYDDWPIPGATKTRFYLHSNGNANTLFGDGCLNITKPISSEPPDKYTYDPDNPTTYITDPNTLQLGEPWDQQAIERRPDVLVYTSEPLTEDIVICGRVFVELYISSDVPGTDFTAKLVDVYPNGVAIQVCDGIQRAEFRNSLQKAEWLESDKVYRLTIDVWATGLRFFQGHRIRLEISSSATIKFARHLNTNTDQASETKPRIARQLVHHTEEYPSALIAEINNY